MNYTKLCRYSRKRTEHSKRNINTFRGMNIVKLEIKNIKFDVCLERFVIVLCMCFLFFTTGPPRRSLMSRGNR